MPMTLFRRKKDSSQALPRDLRVLVSVSPREMRMTPKGKLQVSPLELAHGRLFLRFDLIIDKETSQLLSSRSKKHYRNIETKFYPPPIKTRPQVKPGAPRVCCHPNKWKGPCHDLVSIPSAGKLRRIPNWVHVSRIKPVSCESSQEPSPKTYPCKPIKTSSSSSRNKKPVTDQGCDDWALISLSSTSLTFWSNLSLWGYSNSMSRC